MAHPREVKRDASGVLKHKDGRAVKMRGDVPHSRGVDVNEAREMRPQPGGPGYLTRQTQTGAVANDGDANLGGSQKPSDMDGDLATARADYQKLFGKRPFTGWDTATLREKIVAKAD